MASSEWSFENFRKLNPTSRGYDYLNLVYQARDVPGDFILWMSRLFRPQFLRYEGTIFVNDLFDKERYEELVERGEAKTSIQFWMTLLEITALFPSLDAADAREIAASISKCWNDKLAEEKCDAPPAAVVTDAEGEVFVAIGSQPLVRDQKATHSG